MKVGMKMRRWDGSSEGGAVDYVSADISILDLLYPSVGQLS